MKNHYTASEVVEVGSAQDLILGMKPESLQTDSILGSGFQTVPDSQDIDESDE